MKNLIYLFLFFLLSTCLYPQSTTMVLDGKKFIYQNNTWYVEDNATTEKFKVDVTSITVKLNENIPYHAFENYCNAKGIDIVRKNILGYIDLRLPQNAVFYTSYNQLKNLGFFESVHINTFAKPTYDCDEPDDPYFSLQYYLQNTDYHSYPQINAICAWHSENGSTNPVPVAVIGLGVDQDHLDLNYFDENRGYDFYNDLSDPQPLNDDHHETNVAGIIAAITNNDLGVSGVAGGWGDERTGAEIMALKVGEEEDWYSNVVDDAIIYAANNGAKVINMSFWDYDSPALQAAVKYAHDEFGCVLVSVTGHYGGAGIPYPARYPEVLAIQGVFKDWTRQGRTGDNATDIDVTAPGEDIYTTFNGNQFGNAGYGTSFAAPQASGVAALLLSKNPDLAPIDVKNVLKSSALYEGNLQNDPYQFGSGMLKADRAISCLFDANGIIPDAPKNLTTILSINSNPTLRWQTYIPTEEEEELYDIRKYYIYRSTAPERYKLTKVAEVDHQSGYTYTYWTDNSYLYTGGGIPHYYYRVTTITDSDLESITSYEVMVDGNVAWKLALSNTTGEKQYRLEQNYPNPFNPSTTFHYSIKEDGKVSLKIYDLLGRELAELINEFKEAGDYKVHFNTDNIIGGLASGVYIYRLVSGSYSSSKKFTLIK